jgi:hypothetical protein
MIGKEDIQCVYGDGCTKVYDGEGVQLFSLDGKFDDEMIELFFQVYLVGFVKGEIYGKAWMKKEIQGQFRELIGLPTYNVVL